MKKKTRAMRAKRLRELPVTQTGCVDAGHSVNIYVPAKPFIAKLKELVAF